MLLPLLLSLPLLSGGAPGASAKDCRVTSWNEARTSLSCSGGITITRFSGPTAATAAAQDHRDYIAMVKESGQKPNANAFVRKNGVAVSSVRVTQSGRGGTATILNVWLDHEKHPQVAVSCNALVIGEAQEAKLCQPLATHLLLKAPKELGIAHPPTELFGKSIALPKGAKHDFVYETMWNAVDSKGGRVYLTHLKSDAAGKLGGWMQGHRDRLSAKGWRVHDRKISGCKVDGRASTACLAVEAFDGKRRVHSVVAAAVEKAGWGANAGSDIIFHCEWAGTSSDPGPICLGALRVDNAEAKRK